MSEEYILEVKGLSQYFDRNRFKAVDNVSFGVKKGEVFGIVGESGCGKTTTGRAIMKLSKVTSGDVYYKSERITAGTLRLKEELSERRKALDALRKSGDASYNAERAKFAEFEAKQHEKIKAAEKDAKRGRKGLTGIQMIFQDPMSSLDPRMTVRAIVTEGLVIQGERDAKILNDRAVEALAKVGLPAAYADRFPHEMSGGQRQRVGIARAIVMKPDIIIADEPVSALDVSVQAQVINLLNDLKNEMGLTIIFIAHDLSVVKYFSDRIMVMNAGRTMEIADSDELFADPLHPYTKSLLSAIPLPDPIEEKKRRRIVYDPATCHDYSKEQPTLREVKPGHSVLCNTAEFERYTGGAGSQQ